MIRLLLYWCMLLFLFFCSCTSKTIDKEEQKRNDSIQKYLDLAGNNSLDSKLRNKYNGKAFSLVDLSKNDTLTRFYLSSLSFNYMKVKNEKELRKIGKMHFEKSSAVKDTLNLARYYRYIAGYFKNISLYDSSYYYYLKSEKLYKKTHDENGLAIVNTYKSQIQFRFDDYTGAYLSAKKAYKYFKKTDYKRLELDALITIGNNNQNLREYENAINAFKTAMVLIEQYKLTDKKISLKGTCLNNIGNVYREEKKYQRAIYYFNLALKEKNLIIKDPVLCGFLLNNLSDCKLKLKDYSGFPNLLFKSIELLNNSEEGIKESTISYVYLSNYYYAIEDSLKAQIYAERALKNAKKVKSPYYYLTALSNAGSVNSKKASEYIKEYHKKNDSLLFIERNARNQYYKIQLETNEITQEKETAIKQNWIIGSIAGVVIIIIVLLLIITKQRSKQKELQFQQSQQKSNEEIYDLMFAQKGKEDRARQSEKKRIAIELHDGVLNRLASTRLNLNMLSHQKDEETINKCLKNIEGIYKIEQEIRNIAHDLNTEIFNTTNSFISLLNDFVVTQNETTNSKYTLETDTTIDWSHISSGIKMNLYRIIQEASHNINKYAQASNVMISLILDENNICLSITDDGKGFDTNVNFEGIGLKNIKHRVKSLKGRVVIQSNSNNTSINITIPLTI